MKVFKINKKEFISTIIISTFCLGLAIASYFVPEKLGDYLLGIDFGLTLPVILGITKINRIKEPIEIIEIPEEKE